MAELPPWHAACSGGCVMPVTMRRLLALSLALLPVAAGAQEPPADPPSPPSAPASETAASELDLSAADLAVVTRVEIDEIVFEEVSDPVVRLVVEPEGEVLSHTDRDRLPEPVQTGVPYRDVVVESSFAVWLDVEAILRQATAGAATAPPAPPALTGSDAASPAPPAVEAPSPEPP
jgi:hypothetical protein